MALDFNDALHVFAPKGDEDLDHVEILRSPCDTRPLGMKNSDNKTIAACTNQKIKRIKLQNGLIYLRNFLNNVVSIDAMARVYSMDTSLYLPLIALWDFGAAFPSVLHAWLLKVLITVRLPDGAYRCRVHVLDGYGLR